MFIKRDNIKVAIGIIYIVQGLPLWLNCFTVKGKVLQKFYTYRGPPQYPPNQGNRFYVESSTVWKIVALKGQSHEKVGEMSVWGISLGPTKNSY
jgi:hypothetical protein